MVQGFSISYDLKAHWLLFKKIHFQKYIKKNTKLKKTTLIHVAINVFLDYLNIISLNKNQCVMIDRWDVPQQQQPLEKRSNQLAITHHSTRERSGLHCSAVPHWLIMAGIIDWLTRNSNPEFACSLYDDLGLLWVLGFWIPWFPHRWEW